MCSVFVKQGVFFPFKFSNNDSPNISGLGSRLEVEERLDTDCVNSWGGNKQKWFQSPQPKPSLWASLLIF